MRILRATHLGMCFGVRDAIALANQKVEQAPVTVLGELVHNETVLRSLQSRGVRFAARLAEVETANVVITAHGTSDFAREEVRQHGFGLIDATCPLVHHAHRTLQKLVGQGFYPVIIGKRDHVEVRGLTGDLDEFDVVLSEEDVGQVKERPRFGVISQTTQPIERVRQLVQCLRARFPESQIEFRDTVCQPTKQRQSAAIELSRQADVVVVIGGSNSNNTRELVQTCGRYCARVYHVQTAADLRRDWFAGAATVGLTAGTSTPDETINSVEEALAHMADWKEAA
jgi:4-hydroxy-3-methylbut-2-en-1-yl diphosphate reductase